MKALFLNPAYGDGFTKSARWFAKSRGRVQRHPDQLCYAIAVVEEAGHDCHFVDGAAKGTTKAETEQLLKDYQPDMVVIQGSTPSIYSDLDYARLAKETLSKDVLTVMVGPHSSAEPDDTLRNGQGHLNVVTRGEFDYTLRDLANGDDLGGVQGIAYWDNGTSIHTMPRPLIQDVDALPFAAWHHIDPYDYPDAGKRFPFVTLIGGRGCEAYCTFCVLPQVMYGQKYRARSPELIVDEMEHDLALFPFLKEIMFEDDTLTLRRHWDRLEAICEEILRRDLKISWSCNVRPDFRNEELMRLMKRAGCRWVCVGFEFGNQQILNNIRKGTKLEHMREFAEIADRVGLQVNGCFMIGGPGETRQTAVETIDFAKSIPIDTAQFTGVAAYPGTQYYDEMKEGGYLVPQDWTEWVDDNLEQRTLIDFPQLSIGEINELVDKGLHEFYMRPSQMWRTLKNVRSWSDAKTKFHGLMSFLDYFNNRPQETAVHPTGR